MHQPIEPFIEPGEVERVRQGKARGRRTIARRLEASRRLPLDPPLQAATRDGAMWQRKQPKPCTLTKARNLPPPARSSQSSERMADGDGVGRPVLFALGAAGDEAEIDQA